MGLRISGKSVDVGEAFRGHVDDRINAAIAKYFDGGFSGHVTVEREGSGFRTYCSIHLDTGIVLRADGQGPDVPQSFDRAADRIEKRLRRYNRRLKEHPKGGGTTTLATTYIIEAPDENSETVDADPLIIAEETTDLQTMTVGEAVMAMDLAEATVIVFRHAAHGGVNVVYRRADGNIGWIDPLLAKNSEGAKR